MADMKKVYGDLIIITLYGFNVADPVSYYERVS